MKNLLWNIDLFGTFFQFTIFKQEKFTTSLGGIISLGYIVIIGITVAFLSKNFYTRDSPRSYQEIVDTLVEPEPFSVTTESLPLCWSIMVNDTKRVNDTQKIYLNVNHTDWLINKESTKVFSKRVNETSIFGKEDFKWSTNWWCLNLGSNATFGGGLFSRTIDWYSFFISNCPDKDIYPDRECTPLSEVKEYLKSTKTLIEFLYPSYNYNAHDPLHIQWIKYSTPISIGLSQSDQIYLRNVTIQLDEGWAGSEGNTTTYLSLFSRDVSFTFNPYTELGDSEEYLFYKSEVYIDRTNVKYFRSYMKIQEVLAEVGGIINIMMLCFKLLSDHYNKHKRNEFIFNELFEYNCGFKDSKSHIR
jgi:hypothetical protein